MPNWCFNHLYITGDKESLDKFASQVDEGAESGDDLSIIETFLPFPDDLGDGWYDWCVTNWGTKWGDCHTRREEAGEGLHYVFDTAWSPPIEAIISISKLFPDLKFVIVYEEGGMGFMGGDYIRNGETVMDVSVPYPEIPDIDEDDLPYDPYDALNDAVFQKFNKLADDLRAAAR